MANFISTKKAMQRSGVAESTLRRWASDGKIAAAQVVAKKGEKRKWMYDETSLKKYLAICKHKKGTSTIKGVKYGMAELKQIHKAAMDLEKKAKAIEAKFGKAKPAKKKAKPTKAKKAKAKKAPAKKKEKIPPKPSAPKTTAKVVTKALDKGTKAAKPAKTTRKKRKTTTRKKKKNPTKFFRSNPTGYFRRK